MTAPGQHLAGLILRSRRHLASSGASFTDYLTGWGTIALAVATFAAVIVTLRQAGADRRRLETERDRHWRAQARLVLMDMPGVQIESTRLSHNLVFGFRNCGEQSVMDVHSEAWEGTAVLDQKATWELTERVVLPGEWQRWVLDVPARPDGPPPALRAWRYRWTDADGRQWCVDQPQQPEPLPFKGQQPRPY
jgi:hypothetical protein